MTIPFPTRGRAFTLIELLVTISVIGILVTMAASGLGNARRKAKRLGCVNNLRQLGISSQSFGDQNSGYLTGVVGDADDDQNWLYPELIGSLNVFVCPETRNTVKPSSVEDPHHGRPSACQDLLDNAQERTAQGSSYEVFGFMSAIGEDVTAEFSFNGLEFKTNGVKKSLSSVQAYTHRFDAFGFRGIAAGPSRIWLMVDGDDTRHFNLPRPTGNHGTDGANVLFCDGHVEWIKLKDYVRSYELSQDENRAK